ncbi:MAG: hypothetical protein LBR37_00875 [Erysipelotrichaceae bacterium]|jgi:glycosidase|nr:hypothetical protein [Erysipelotrichaceae bacterium]
MKLKCLLLGLLTVATLASCGPDDPPPGETHTVTFDKGYDTPERYVEVEVAHEAKVTAITVSREGFYLESWNRDGAPYDFSTAVISDFTLVASWTEERVDGEYEQWIDSWSQPGHLYIHYKRLDAAGPADYNKYALWIWQNKPLDLEGALYAYSGSTSGTVPMHPMSTSWMSNIGGGGQDMDQSGRIIDVNLNDPNIVGGKTGQPTTFEGATQVGFLIPQISSMGGGSHWVSDGGANTYIKNFDQTIDAGGPLRSNGARHVFLISGAVDQYRYTYSDTYDTNPTVSDTTGQYRSEYALANTSHIDNQPAVTTSPSFKQLGIGYQIFVASFRDSNGDGLGDINGIRDALDYLAGLGVNVLWLTPVQESESYHGYDVTDYEKIDSKFGTMEDYENLLSEAHAKGMKVMMDLVLNHTSKNNVWFKNSQKAVVENGINYRNLYHWKYSGDQVRKVDQINSSVNPPTATYKQVPVQNHEDWYKDGESSYYYFGKFGSGMVELNYDNQDTRDLAVDTAKFWMNKGVDGFRLDAIKHIYMADETSNVSNDVVIDVGERTFYDDEMGQTRTVPFDYSSDRLKNVNFWKEFANGVKRDYPNCFFVGENFDGWDQRIAPYYEALDSQFDFGLYFHNHDAVCNLPNHHGADEFQNPMNNSQRIQSTYDMFASGVGPGNTGGYVKANYDGRPDFINSAFTSNHDANRAINEVANWGGDVSGTAVEKGLAQYHAATTLLQRGISWIYYGDELGMSGNTSKHKEMYGSDNSKDIWYRQPFKWGDNAVTTDYKAGSYQIEWDDYNKNSLQSVATQDTTAGSMLKLYQELGRIKNLAGFPDQGKYTAITDNDNVVAFNLYDGVNSMNVYINTTGSTISMNTTGPVVGSWNSTAGSLGAYGFLVTQPTGGVTNPGDWYVVGNFSNWQEDLTNAHKMTINPNYKGEGTEYYVTNVSFQAGDQFKLYNPGDGRWITSGWETGENSAFAAGLIELVSDGYGGNNVSVLVTCRLDIYFKDGPSGPGSFSCWIQANTTG